MASVEFMLARMTAKSQGLKPKMPGGAQPYLTVEDIALGAALVRNANAYQLVMAKYVQDEVAIERSLDFVRQWSWHQWHKRKRQARTDTKTMDLLAEIALLDFMVPALIKKKGAKGRAIHIGVSRKTWSANYENHWSVVTAYLFKLEVEAVDQLVRRLK